MPPAAPTAVERLDELIQMFEQHPDPLVQERLFELLQCVDIIHRTGLRRLLDLLQIAGLHPRALQEPDIRLLLDLYDLREGGERERADAVLDLVRPYIESHGGRLEVAEARAGVVKVRLSGACQGCRGSEATLSHVIEQTLRDSLPDFVRMEALESAPPSSGGFIPLTSLIAPGSGPLEPAEHTTLDWHTALHSVDVPEGEVRGVQVEGEPVLIAHIGGEFYGFLNACPEDSQPLDAGRVEGETLECPWHGCRFDLRSGRRLGADASGLIVAPIAVEAGEVRVGVLTGASA
ncbi:MAG: NifU family protein [Armatimonadetes bacterium]|nr:NifU family protein [Armatimonadota bacterium]